jgi:phage repressor protein C with HTH and peptisase S24 domain
VNVKASLGQDEKLIAQRIAEAVRETGGPAVISRVSDTPMRTLSKYIAADATPSASALGRIARATQRSADWLLGLDNAKSGMAPSGQDSPVHIPILDLSAGAGNAIDNGEVEIIGQMPFPREVLQRLGIKPDRVRALRGRGISMEPTISDGALVLVNIAKERLVDGQVYALRAPDGLRIKRLQRQMDGGLLLISDNRDLFEPERLPPHEAEQISVLGRVFWTERLL